MTSRACDAGGRERTSLAEVASSEATSVATSAAAGAATTSATDASAATVGSTVGSGRASGFTSSTMTVFWLEQAAPIDSVGGMLGCKR